MADHAPEVDSKDVTVSKEIDQTDEQEVLGTSKELQDDHKVKQLQDQTNFLPTKQVVIVFFGLSLGVFLAFLEQTILGTALFSITSDLGGGKESSWIITSYLLVSTSLTPIYGRISDIYGRRPLLLICLIEFFIASLACAVSQTATQLIIFRAFQGIGGGAIITLVLIIISDVVSLRDRGKYQGILEVVITIASGIGPVLGGVFAEVGWRWIFWINLPLGAITIFVSWRLLPLRPVEGKYKEKLAKVDYGGCTLVLAASVLVLLGLNWGGVQYEWASAPVLSTLLIGAALYVVFVLYEWKVPKLPIIDLGVFRHSTVIGVFILTSTNGAFHYGMLYYIPQFLQVVKGFTALRSGVLTLPYLCTVAPSVFTCGQLISITGRYRPQIFVGAPLLVVGTGLLITLDESSSVAKICGIQAFLGLSAGCLYQTSLVALHTAVSRAEMAVATSIRNFIRLLSGTIWLAVAAALLQNALNSVTLPDDIRAEIRNDPGQIRSFNLDAITIDEVLGAYVDGFRLIFIITTALTGIGCIASYGLIKHHNLTKAGDEQAKADSKAWLAERKALKRSKELSKEETGSPA